MPYRIAKKRLKPRRKRPELFPPKSPDPWPKISAEIRLKWWFGRAVLTCGICGEAIKHWLDLVPDHIIPGKMGGCKDHSESNLQPSHKWCNLEKGSKRKPVMEAK